jgi:hypothetical protein
MYLTICPDHPDFILGTYFITVQGMLTDSSFSITARTVELPVTPPTPTQCLLPPNLAGTHECVYDGIPTVGSFNELDRKYFVYSLYGCQQVFGASNSFNLFRLQSL